MSCKNKSPSTSLSNATSRILSVITKNQHIRYTHQAYWAQRPPQSNNARAHPRSPHSTQTRTRYRAGIWAHRLMEGSEVQERDGSCPTGFAGFGSWNICLALVHENLSLEEVTFEYISLLRCHHSTISSISGARLYTECKHYTHYFWWCDELWPGHGVLCASLKPVATSERRQRPRHYAVLACHGRRATPFPSTLTIHLHVHGTPNNA